MSSGDETVYVSETGYDFTKIGFDLNAVLSGHRVSQMTQTFADVDAFQKLLEEKEKDLELAARIGQQLLEQNQTLGERVTALEHENKESIESITQLKHELHFKTQLLELYNDSTDSAENSKVGTPLDGVGAVATVLERRLQSLEEENKVLRAEACMIAEEVEKTEAEEKYLVEDAIKRLAESNYQITTISDELQKKTEQVKEQQDELIVLDEELKVSQETNQELLGENIELHKLVDVLRLNQNELGTELIDLKDNYVEVVAILKETQEQLREAQKKKEDGMDVVAVFDSLAYEIDNSVARQRRTSDYFRRTFDTVRCANSKISDASLASSALMSSASSSGYHSVTSGLPSLDSSTSQEIMNSNFSSFLIGSDLGSSLCHSPGGISTPGGSWRLPEKLQIVKPIEGSSTLQIWSALATPHLGNLLDKRPGVKTRVERNGSNGEIGLHTVLELTQSEATALVVSSPAVFSFVTTASSRDRSDSTTTTIYSTNMSATISTCSLSSMQSDLQSPVSVSSSSGDATAKTNKDSKPNTPIVGGTADYLKSCDTPQNSPTEGNSRPMSPSFKNEDMEDKASSRTLKTLYSVYDTLCNKLVGMGSPSRRLDYAQSSQKYDLRTKLGRVEVSFESSRQRAPAKPGTGALEKFLLEPD